MNPKTILIKLAIEIGISLAAAFVADAILDRVKVRQIKKALSEELGLEKTYFDFD